MMMNLVAKRLIFKQNFEGYIVFTVCKDRPKMSLKTFFEIASTYNYFSNASLLFPSYLSPSLLMICIYNDSED